MDQELENRLQQDLFNRQQGENWLKCDDDDVGTLYWHLSLVLQTCTTDYYQLINICTFVRWAQSMKKTCWSSQEEATGTQPTFSSMDPGSLPKFKHSNISFYSLSGIQPTISPLDPGFVTWFKHSNIYLSQFAGSFPRREARNQKQTPPPLLLGKRKWRAKKWKWTLCIWYKQS